MQSKSPKSGGSVKRRQFLQATGASALAMGVWSELPAQESNSPNDKLKVLCASGQPTVPLPTLMACKVRTSLGLCDIDQNYLDRAAKRFPDAKAVQGLSRDDRRRG